MRIDVHTHFYPIELMRRLERRSCYPHARSSDGKTLLHCWDSFALPFVPALHDLSAKLADMDRIGVDVAVLSLNMPGPELAGGTEADELARIANDALAEAIARHPKRLWGLATLGFGSIDATLKELDRCLTKLGFRGLQVMSTINGKSLDAPELRPVFEYMAKANRPIFVHPTMPLNRIGLMDIVPVPAVAFAFDTTLAAVRLAMSGALREYATGPIIIPHVGGTLPYLMPRIEGLMAAFGARALEKDPVSYLKRLYMDTVAYTPEPIGYCLAAMGADHLLFGSDHPHGPWQTTADLLDQAVGSPVERALIAHRNAERIFGA